MKTSSRSKLAKIFVKPPFQEYLINDAITEPDLSSQNTFRKGIIHKLFDQLKIENREQVQKIDRIVAATIN